MNEYEITKTKNVKEAIEDYASKNNISTSICDFKIEKTDTYISDVSSKDFNLVNEDINNRYKNKNKIVDEHVEIEQVHHIHIKKQNRFLIKLKYEIELDEFSIYPKIILKTNSRIPYQQYGAKKLFFMLLEEINKIKVKHGMLIDLFDYSMRWSLKKFVKLLYKQRFVKQARLPLFSGVVPTGATSSSLTMNFTQKDVNRQVVEVKEGDVLITFVKPYYGKNGFNAYGKQVESIIVKKAQDIDVSIDKNSIKIIEDDKRKQYISKKKGFVHLDEKSLSVDNKLEVEKLSRVEKELTKTEDNNIEVDVSQDNVNFDTIGAGVKLTSEKIYVKGHVGKHSVLETETLQVDGSTHHDSTQFAKFAKIHRNKGILRCHKAQIKFLETGEIHATTAIVDETISGAVYAQDVIIDKVRNNLYVCASNSIVIRAVIGEDNIFKISYKDVPILISKINLIDKDMLKLKTSIKELSNDEKSQKADMQSKIQKLEDEKLSIINSVKTAKISIEKKFIGLNTIIFTIDENHEIIFKTESIAYKPFYLEISSEKITLQPVNKSISYNI